MQFVLNAVNGFKIQIAHKILAPNQKSFKNKSKWQTQQKKRTQLFMAQEQFKEI